MKEQNYKNHVQYYPAHHFIFYPAILALMIFSAIGFFNDTRLKWIWFSIFGLAILVTFGAFMMRQHYSVK